MSVSCVCITKYSIVQKLSNKQSGKVICRFDRLRISHSKRQKSFMRIKKLLSVHAFNYIVLKVNPGQPVVKTLLCPWLGHMFFPDLKDHDIAIPAV